jgi:hypothetical protein
MAPQRRLLELGKGRPGEAPNGLLRAKEEQPKRPSLPGPEPTELQRKIGDFFLHAKAYRFRLGRLSVGLRACATGWEGFCARADHVVSRCSKLRAAGACWRETAAGLRVTGLFFILLQASFVTRLFSLERGRGPTEPS